MASGGATGGFQPDSGYAGEILPPRRRKPITSLQIGANWFPEGRGGGLERLFYNLMRFLPEAGVAVRGLVAASAASLPASDGAVAAFAAADAPILRRLIGARRAIGTAIAKESPDIIAVHFSLYAAAALDAIAALPMVLHFHGPWAAESRAEGGSALAAFVKARMERRVYRHARRAIVLSGAFAEILHRSYRFPRERIRIVPGGIDPAQFFVPFDRREARARLGLPLDRPIIVCVRRIARRMGLDNLVEAMVELRRSCPEAFLVVVGKGRWQPELQALVAARGLTRHVHLAGYVSEPDLPLYYRAGEVSIVPSVALEGFGLAAAESLAAGTPALVTPVGGLPEVVAGLSRALVLEAATVAALAQGLRAALRHDLALPSAAHCRAYATRMFAWPRIAAQICTVYAEIA